MNAVYPLSLRIFLFALLHFAMVGLSRAEDFHVSPAGDDAASGSLQKPFRTLLRARDAVRALGTTSKSDTKIYLSGGTYTLAAPLALDQRDSGCDGFRVMWLAEPGQQPVISGGRVVKNWISVDPAHNRCQAAAPVEFARQLWVNGRRAERPRLGRPPLPKAVLTSAGYEVPGLSPICTWSNPTDLEFIYSATQGGTVRGLWVESRLGFSQIRGTPAGTSITMNEAGWGANHAESDQIGLRLPSDVENVKELLQQPGQWYFDRPSKTISYLPRTGENVATAEGVVPELETLLVASGTIDEPLHNVTFSGITFSYTTWARPSSKSGFVEGQANFLRDGTRLKAAVSLHHVQHVTFERCRFTHLGAGGLELLEGAQDNLIQGNVFSDISGNNLMLGSTSDPERKEKRLRDTGNRLRNNLFRDTVVEFRGGVPIFCGYVAHTEIEHNEIVNAPYSAISVGWGWGRSPSYMQENQIRFNRVDHYCQKLGDGGGWYALSDQPGTEISSNYISDGMSWRNGAALYPDEGSAHMTLQNNVLQRIPRWIFIHIKSIHHITAKDNWTETTSLQNHGVEITLENNHEIGDPPPAGAERVQQTAGLESAYADLRVPSPNVVLHAPVMPPIFPAVIQLEADASEAKSGVEKVEFFDFSTKIGEARRSPYKCSWAPAGPGLHELTAMATDREDVSQISTSVKCKVPLILLKPSGPWVAPATVELAVLGAEENSRMTKVEFFDDTTKIGQVTALPFRFLWTKVGAGTHRLVAKATVENDDVTTSQAVEITVGATAP